MLSNRLFCDRSMASKFCILQCLGMFPDKRLFDKSTSHKFVGPMVKGAILPVRKFLARSRVTNFFIRWKMFVGNGPERKFFLNERYDPLGHNGSEPVKLL